MNYRSELILTLMVMLVVCLTPAFAQTAIPEVTVETEPDAMPTATLGGMALQFVSGRAAYQNRQPDQSGIEVRVLDEALNLIGVAHTDSQGVYAVAAPSNAFYWLVMDAPLHRQQTIPVQPGQRLPDMILAGGDFNEDGCTGPTDLAALVSALDVPDSLATDVTGDGITDVSDLAIVTGNYQPDCEPETLGPEATAEVTPEVVSTAEATPEAEVTAELTPEIEVTTEITPEVEPTQAATSEATQEVTPEVTAELTPEVTAEIEITAQVTAEVTDEPTAEATDEPPTATLVPTPTLTAMPEPTATPTLTPEPTTTPTETPSEIIEEGTEESTS